MTTIHQHTPGPWLNITHAPVGVLICNADDPCWHVAKQGDKALLLAAPDLLGALELCEDVLSDLARLDDGTPSISALNLVRAVLAKVKGGAQ
jgi:hypothetical protein